MLKKHRKKLACAVDLGLLWLGTASLLLTLAAAPEGSRASPPPADVPQINAHGTFKDRAGWMYRDASGGFHMSAPFDGTNEFLQLPPPSPPDGGSVIGVVILRHPGDHMGYPSHISLLAKAFARAKSLQEVYVMDSASSFYRFDVSEIWNQHTVLGDDDNKNVVRVVGPISAAAAVPFTYQTAFEYARTSLQSIVNLPNAEKTMANYEVAFVETQDMIWVEFGPHYALTESPHLGCQTELGRDVVFGFMKSDLAQGNNDSRFLQCF